MTELGKTPRRTFRISDDLYASVKAKAAERSETVTSIILAALKEYTNV